MDETRAFHIWCAPIDRQKQALLSCRNSGVRNGETVNEIEKKSFFGRDILQCWCAIPELIFRILNSFVIRNHRLFVGNSSPRILTNVKNFAAIAMRIDEECVIHDTQ